MHSKVTVWPEISDDGNAISLTCYTELFQGGTDEQEEEWNAIMLILLDQAIGEINNMRYIDEIKLNHEPCNQAGMPMSELLQFIL